MTLFQTIMYVVSIFLVLILKLQNDKLRKENDELKSKGTLLDKLESLKDEVKMGDAANVQATREMLKIVQKWDGAGSVTAKEGK